MSDKPSLRLPTRLLSLLLVGCMLASAPFAAADPISSTVILTETSRSIDLDTIQQALEHKLVQQRLGELGFTTAEIDQRLANANDSELHQLATQSEAILAGGDGGIIITVLLIVLLVMVILRIR